MGNQGGLTTTSQGTSSAGIFANIKGFYESDVLEMFQHGFHHFRGGFQPGSQGSDFVGIAGAKR